MPSRKSGALKGGRTSNRKASVVALSAQRPDPAPSPAITPPALLAETVG